MPLLRVAGIGEGEQEIGRLGGVGRGADNGAAVVLQDFQPVADIVGVADGRHDAERGAKKGAAHFRDQFLAGIGFAAKPSGEVAVEAVLGSAPMR